MTDHSFRERQPGHHAYMTAHIPPRPCTAHDLTIGGRCLNCGYGGAQALDLKRPTLIVEGLGTPHSAVLAALRRILMDPAPALPPPIHVPWVLIPLTPEQITDRAVIVHESDAMCGGCGADPRANNGTAIADPAWYIDSVLVPEAREQVNCTDRIAEICCPKCW
jgi:hypothetical protein